jgi:hypothetical protein
MAIIASQSLITMHCVKVRGGLTAEEEEAPDKAVARLHRQRDRLVREMVKGLDTEMVRCRI